MRCSHVGPVAVLAVIVVQGCFSDVTCSEDSNQWLMQPQPESALTEQLRAHNVASLLRQSERGAQQSTYLTPKEARLMLAAYSTPPETSLEAHINGSDFSESPSKGQQTPELLQLHDNLAVALGAAGDVVDKARSRWVSNFDSRKNDSNLLEQLKEVSTTAVKSTFAKLFGSSETNLLKGVTQEVKKLLAPLFQQQQLASTTHHRHAEAKQKKDDEEQTRADVVRRSMRRGGTGAVALREFAEDPTNAGSRGTQEKRPPTLTGLNYGTLQQIRKMVGTVLPGSQESPVSLLEGISDFQRLQDQLVNIVDAMDKEDAGNMAASGLGTTFEAPSSLPLELRSIMTQLGDLPIPPVEIETLKSWESLVKAYKQHGRVDYSSTATVNLMQKLAVVLACTYKAAKDVLGESESDELIRAMMSPNEFFKVESFSSSQKALMGDFQYAEEKVLAAEDSTDSREGLSSESVSPAAPESRLMFELLAEISHKPPAFYRNVTKKYHDTLSRWGVKPNELSDILKHILALSRPLEKEHIKHTTGR